MPGKVYPEEIPKRPTKAKARLMVAAVTLILTLGAWGLMVPCPGKVGF